MNKEQAKRLELIKGYTEQLQTIELLEYHNKNHLQYGANPKLRSERKQELIVSILYELAKL